MGESQSRPAAATSGGDAVGIGETLDGVAACASHERSELVPASDAGGQIGEPAAQSPHAASPEGASPSSSPTALAVASDQPQADAVVPPSESEILYRLVANLGQCPGQSMALSEIRERLPPALRRLAEDTDSICKWLRGFPGLLEVSGEPGRERVMLTVGKIPRPGGAEPVAAPATAAATAARLDATTTARINAVQALTAPAAGIASVGGDVRALPASAGTACTLPAPGNGAASAELSNDEEGLNPATVQLRGLPFRATIADIKAFLGEHSAGLTSTEPAIRLLLNRDGRPSGFARVQFATPQAAQACRETLHRKPMGDRYVEVLACSDRAGKMRNRRAAEVEGASGPGLADGAEEYAERERVLQECRDHMRMPGRNQLLLSMLGIALSPPARAYLRRANLGLKHFLARLPNEFRVEGPKGCERVYWCGAGSTVDMNFVVPADAMQWAVGLPMGPEPGTPNKSVLTPDLASIGGQSGGGHCLATPSNWGTPGPGLLGGAASGAGDSSTQPGDATDTDASTLPGASGASALDFGAGAWGAYGWTPPWQWDQPWPHMGGDCGAGAGKGLKADGRNESKSKRGSRGDAAPARSHAHLHPQSHPFANKTAAAAEGSSSTAPAGNTDTEGPATVAALRLRGLPFSVTVQDVLAFFAQHDVADRIADGPQAAQLLAKANGRPSGQAVVQMRSRLDAEIAQRALSKQWIGGRYIEVFVYGGEESGFDGMLEGDAAAGALPAVSPPSAKDLGGDLLQGITPSPWSAMPPWAGLMPPPPVAGGAAGVGDPSADWLRTLNPWGVPWAGFGPPPAVAGGSRIPGGSDADMDVQGLVDRAMAAGAASGCGVGTQTLPARPTAGVSLEPADTPARPTLQV